MNEIDELKAHVGMLRGVISHAACELAESDIEDDDGLKELHEGLISALNETAQQSLIHVRAQVEEETIERCIYEVDFAVDKTTAYWAIRNMTRKYKG